MERNALGSAVAAVLAGRFCKTQAFLPFGLHASNMVGVANQLMREAELHRLVMETPEEAPFHPSYPRYLHESGLGVAKLGTITLRLFKALKWAALRAGKNVTITRQRFRDALADATSVYDPVQLAQLSRQCMQRKCGELQEKSSRLFAGVERVLPDKRLYPDKPYQMALLLVYARRLWASAEVVVPTIELSDPPFVSPARTGYSFQNRVDTRGEREKMSGGAFAFAKVFFFFFLLFLNA